MFGTSLQHRRTKERRELFLCILRFSTLSCDISGFSDYEVDIPEKLSVLEYLKSNHVSMKTRAVRRMIELDDGSRSHSILSRHDHDAQKTSKKVF